MRKLEKLGLVLSIFTFGLIIGYVITLFSLFPTSYGNLIFATVPIEVPYSNKPTPKANVAHLWLEHDMNLLRKQSWNYVLSLSDANGKRVGIVKFDPAQVGGLFNLNSVGSLEWDKNADAVTVRMKDFVYRYEL